MFQFSGPRACETLVPWPKFEPMPPTLEGKVLTNGSPEKSLKEGRFEAKSLEPWEMGHWEEVGEEVGVEAHFGLSTAGLELSCGGSGAQ